jgi:hypothetical protein
VGHQVSNLCPREIGRREGLKVKEETVSECLFHPAGRPEEEVPPNISKSTNAQSQKEYFPGIDEEAGGKDPPPGKIVNGIFDDPGDEELENIDDKEGEQSD